MKAYAVINPYVVCIETTGLIPISRIVVDADYALYRTSASKILIKKIFTFKGKGKVSKSEKKWVYNTLNDLTHGGKVDCWVYKTLKAAKAVCNNSFKSNGWKKKYDDDGSLCQKTLYKYDKLITHNPHFLKQISRLYSNSDVVIEHNILHNYTCIRNLQNEIILKVTGIAYFNKDTTQITSIRNYKNRRMNGFEKCFNKNGVLTEVSYYKNDKFNGKSFDSHYGFRFFQNDYCIFTKISSIFHHVSYLINQKGKIKVI
jgi:hypothetical protein